MSEKTGLDLLREPFPAHQISKLPKPSKAQTDAVKADFKKGIRCGICGAWHHPDVIHLDYVGHAALTDRLLDSDPAWTWEPVPNPESLGLPTVPGGLWIRLGVCGVTRLGFGCADDKTGGDAVKETIGDALRNAAMRFGAALGLWHKGQLHEDEPEAPASEPTDKIRAGRFPSAVKATLEGMDQLSKETQRKLSGIGNTLIDLCTQEKDEGKDNEYKLHEELEGLSHAEQLWLSSYLDDKPAVRKRCRVVLENARNKTPIDKDQPAEPAIA